MEQRAHLPNNGDDDLFKFQSKDFFKKLVLNTITKLY